MTTKKGIHTAVLIGAGNVATHLGNALVNKGIKVLQVYSPSGTTAKTLAKKLQAKPIADLKAIDTAADIIIVAIKDDALPTIGKQLRVGNTLVVHTSGATPADVLKKCSTNYGVFYPFQTFNKNVKADFAAIPICIEANNPKAEKQLEGLAKLLVNNYYKLNSDQRHWLHIMGVFSSNFSNLMYHITHTIAGQQNIPFDIVYPLIKQTAAKVEGNIPAAVQTGPAVRGDKKVVKMHLKKLEENKEFQKIYSLLSNAIENINN
ncbi:MAG: DUF2520 domain-containing protein [Sphingobacteriales bacterium JAD_PAG50586_3]|nr:MAG: DUF2520 domain-containing protein [Sphingobacteriales bacterium JAD_PAG50586_3]